MAGKKDRIDTAALFQNMVPQKTEEEQVTAPVEVEPERKVESSEPAPVAKGRKPKKEKNVQVSIYLQPDQAKELRVQDAMKEKENDKSAIARMGIDIVLQMSSEVYSEMKAKAAAEGILPGELVEAALKAYLK